MTAGQVIVTVSLLARVYGVSPVVMDCIARCESDYNVDATNGVHVGVMQWAPSTLEWLGEKAGKEEE